MRGGISCGDFYTAHSERTGGPILFGRAYNNAVDLEKSEKCGKQPVIIVDENIGINNLKNIPFLAHDDEFKQFFVNYMHNAEKVGAFNIKMRFVAKEIINRIKEFESDAAKKGKYVWTKNFIINSLSDESVFSEENISLCETSHQPLNLKLEFIKQEEQNGQAENGNP